MKIKIFFPIFLFFILIILPSRVYADWTTPDDISSFSSENIPQGFYANKSIDDNLNTAWYEASPYASPPDVDGTYEWFITYDMGSTDTYSKIRIQTDPDAFYAPCKVEIIKVCDDADCSGEDNLLGSTCSLSGSSKDWYDCSFSATEGRYIYIEGGFFYFTSECVDKDLYNNMYIFYEFDAYIQPADSEAPKYYDNSTNSTYAGQAIEFRLNWTDNVGLSKAITSIWNGSSWVNASTWCSLSGTTSWCNQTLVVNETAQQLWWKQYANDTNNNWNTSENFSLVTTTYVFIDIIPSSDLDDGIQFGSVDPGTNDNVATKNVACNSGACYNITIDPATTVNVDLYHKTDGDLGTIEIENVTHQANITSNTGDNLIASGSISLTTSYAIIGTDVCQNIGDDVNCWIRYWFDVPSGQSPGDLETTYYYCAVETGQGSEECT